jgi:arsenate reductase
MTTIQIYHNPKCSKSRQALTILEERGISPEIILYLKIPPSPAELVDILAQLKFTPRQLIRTGEAIYKELGLKDSDHTDIQLITIMSEHPKLIERPIVINNGVAKVGRPPESVIEIL